MGPDLVIKPKGCFKKNSLLIHSNKLSNHRTEKLINSLISFYKCLCKSLQNLWSNINAYNHPLGEESDGPNLRALMKR